MKMVNLGAKLNQKLDEESEEYSLTRTGVIRKILGEYFLKKKELKNESED